jgi:caa(3)-type oxidase subunit IV
MSEHGHTYYVKIWAILVVLLVLSVVGPFIGTALSAQWITLLTAFGIAVVKAYMVAAKFMHLEVEKRLASHIILTALALVILFYGAVAADVMNHNGTNWEHVAAGESTEAAKQEICEWCSHHDCSPRPMTFEETHEPEWPCAAAAHGDGGHGDEAGHGDAEHGEEAGHGDAEHAEEGAEHAEEGAEPAEEGAEPAEEAAPAEEAPATEKVEEAPAAH